MTEITKSEFAKHIDQLERMKKVLLGRLTHGGSANPNFSQFFIFNRGVKS